jgi:mRNA-degrading endonuclease RelE of RelBE toxin-antitoxin system
VYRIQYTKVAERGLIRLPANVRRTVVDRIEAVAAAPEAEQPFMTELRGDLKGLCRVRVAGYRAILRIDHEARVLSVLKVGPRGAVYNG